MTYLHLDKILNSEKAFKRSILENELRIAIQLEQFRIDYQPIMDFSKNRLVGAEALIRWEHPDWGDIFPNEFIPLAEQTGLINTLGEWVLFQSCKQNKEWQTKGYVPIKISVNVSLYQLEQSNFVNKIQQILSETGLEAKWINLELTESVFSNNINEVVIALQKVKNLGIHISMDDFGTGYNSFKYIKHFPLDTIKIDASFIQDIIFNEKSRAIANSLLSLAKTLNLNVIAEGIETQEQLLILNQDGFSQGQGYLFSKPLSSHNFGKYLQSYS